MSFSERSTWTIGQSSYVVVATALLSRTRVAMTTAVLPLALKPLYSLVVTSAFAWFASRPELTEASICVQRWPRAACILRTFALTSRPEMAAVRRNASATSVPLRPSAEGANRAGVSSRKGPAEREKEDGQPRRQSMHLRLQKTNVRTFCFRRP